MIPQREDLGLLTTLLSGGTICSMVRLCTGAGCLHERHREASNFHMPSLQTCAQVSQITAHGGWDNDFDFGSGVLGTGRTIHASSFPFPGSRAVALHGSACKKSTVNRGTGGSDFEQSDTEGTFIR